MNYIELRLLFKDGNNVQGTGVNRKIEINLDSATQISPKLFLQQDLDINPEELYGFSGSITCDSKAVIVISDFDYFTLASFENSDTVLSKLKVNNISESFRLNKIKIDRIDIENSSFLLVDCDVREAHVGMGNCFEDIKTKERKEELKNNIDIRNCRIGKITSYVETNNINIQDSVVERLRIQSDSDNLSIVKYSQITDLILSQTINTLRLDNSSIKFIQGTSSLMINKFNNNYSVVSNAYNIFENNLLTENEEAYDLIRMSYRVRKDYDRYAHYSYLINRIYLKNEDHLVTKIPLIILDISCGFGYKLANTIKFSAGVVLLFSMFYFCLTYFGGEVVGLNIPKEYTLVSDKILYSLYHSIVSFATLGYGDTVGQDWVTKFLSAIESLLGIYSMSVIVYTLTKKYSSFK